MENVKVVKERKNYRQGDVILKRVFGQGDDKYRKKLGNILAKGEATGHSHKVIGQALSFVNDSGETILRVVGPCEIVHEEHKTITPEVGDYLMTKQREYPDKKIVD